MIEQRGRTNERGIAMIMVITVLVTLLIVAVAFAPQMQRGRERTEANAARKRADWGSGTPGRQCQAVAPPLASALRGSAAGSVRMIRMIRWATRTSIRCSEITPGEGFRKLLAQEIKTQWLNDPQLVNRLAYLESRGLDPLNDDRGSIWSVDVVDANALVNVNGCSPYLLANLMGSALLTEEIDSGSSTIGVSHVTSSKLSGIVGFNPNGGYIRVGGEVIKYESFDGSEFPWVRARRTSRRPAQGQQWRIGPSQGRGRHRLRRLEDLDPHDRVASGLPHPLPDRR